MSSSVFMLHWHFAVDPHRSLQIITPILLSPYLRVGGGGLWGDVAVITDDPAQAESVKLCRRLHVKQLCTGNEPSRYKLAVKSC